MGPRKKVVASSQPRPSVVAADEAHDLAREKMAVFLTRTRTAGATESTRGRELPPLWKAAGTCDLPPEANSSLYDLVAKAPPVDPSVLAPTKAKKAKAVPKSRATPAPERETEKLPSAAGTNSSDLEYFEVDSDDESDHQQPDAEKRALEILRERFETDILTYMPLHFEACLAVIKDAGTKISKKGLAELLDRSGVVYIESGKPRNGHRATKKTAAA